MIALNIPAETVIFGDATTVNLGHGEPSLGTFMCELGRFRSFGCAQDDAVGRAQDDFVTRTWDEAVARARDEAVARTWDDDLDRAQDHGVGSPHFTSTLEALL